MPVPARRRRAAAAAAAAAAALVCALLAAPAAAAAPVKVTLPSGAAVGVTASSAFATDPQVQQAAWFGSADAAAAAATQVASALDDAGTAPMFVYEIVPPASMMMQTIYKGKRWDGAAAVDTQTCGTCPPTNVAFQFAAAPYTPVSVNGAGYNVKGALQFPDVASLSALPWWGAAAAAAGAAAAVGDAQWSADADGNPIFAYDSYASGSPPMVMVMIKGKVWLNGAASDVDVAATGNRAYFAVLYEGGGNADPHLQGFGGQRYDFCMEGPACRGRALALLTEARHQVNTEVDRFQGPKDAWPYWGNWMVGLGMLHSSGFRMQLRLDTEASGFKVKKIKKGVMRALLPVPGDASSWRSLLRSFEVNGQDLLPRVGSGDALSFGPVTVYLPSGRHAHDPTDGPVAVVTTPDLQITFYLESEDIWHLDFKVTLTPKSSIKRMHGLLGQSAHWADGAPAEVEGGDDLAYAVEGGLLGSSFKYSLYGRGAPVATAATRKLLAADDGAPLLLGAAGSPASLLLA